MPLITLIIYLVLIGVVLYLVGLIPMDATIRRIIQIIVIVAVLLWLVTAFLPAGPMLRFPR